MTTGSSPLDAEDLRVRVGKALEDFLERQVPLLDEVSDELGPVVDGLTELRAKLPAELAAFAAKAAMAASVA